MTVRNLSAHSSTIGFKAQGLFKQPLLDTDKFCTSKAGVFVFFVCFLEGGVFDLRMTEGEEAIPTTQSELEAALLANGIPVSESVIHQLLEQKEWIYQTERVEDLMVMLNKEQLYSLFNSQHHLQSSACLFRFLTPMRKKVAVVYGHKALGKSQFLFFCLQASPSAGGKGIVSG
jgi:hypothetical protein